MELEKNDEKCNKMDENLHHLQKCAMKDFHEMSSKEFRVRRSDDPQDAVDHVEKWNFETRMCLEMNDPSDEHVSNFGGISAVFLGEDGEVVDDGLVGPVLQQKQQLLELDRDDLAS